MESMALEVTVVVDLEGWGAIFPGNVVVVSGLQEAMARAREEEARVLLETDCIWVFCPC